MTNALYGRRRVAWGAVLGLLATLAGLAAAELVVGLVRDASSPVVPVGQWFIDRVPRGVREWAIDTFGTNDKVVLVAGALIVVGLLGLAAGVIAAGGRGLPAAALIAAVGFLGASAVLTRPAPTAGKLMPAVIGTFGATPGRAAARSWSPSPAPGRASIAARSSRLASPPPSPPRRLRTHGANGWSTGTHEKDAMCWRPGPRR